MIILITPPVASEPYTEAPGPLITSILSTALISITWSRFTPVDLLPDSLLLAIRVLVELSTRRPSTIIMTRVSPLIEIPLLKNWNPYSPPRYPGFWNVIPGIRLIASVKSA